MSDDRDNLVDFTKVHAIRTAEQSREREAALMERAHEDFEGDEPVAAVEVFWCTKTFKTSFLVRNGKNTREVEMVPPWNDSQREWLLRELRWVANWQARMMGREDLVREEDWNGRMPEEDDPEDTEEEHAGEVVPWDHDPKV